MPSTPLVTWQTVASPPELDADAIHVWRLSDVPPGADAWNWLDDNERRRVDAITHPKVRQQQFTTRIGLRRVLAGYLGCHPGELRLRVAEGGKPYLSDGPEFNLSHCQGLALLAVAKVPVGIDVEARRTVPRAVQIARRVLDQQAADRLAALPEGERDTAFLAAWTAMEARQKCLGQGVFGHRVSPGEVHALAFRPDPGHQAQLAWSMTLQAPRLQWLAQPDHDPS